MEATTRQRPAGATSTEASNSDLPIYPDLGSLSVPKTYGGGNLHRGEKTEATRQKPAGATRQRLAGQPPRRLVTRICQSIPILKVFLCTKNVDKKVREDSSLKKEQRKCYVLCNFCHDLELPIGLERHTTFPAPDLSQRNHLKSKSIAESTFLRWALLQSTRSGFHLHLGSKRS